MPLIQGSSPTNQALDLAKAGPMKRFPGGRIYKAQAGARPDRRIT